MISIEEHSKLNNHRLTHLDKAFYFIFIYFLQNVLIFLNFHE